MKKAQKNADALRVRRKISRAFGPGVRHRVLRYILGIRKRLRYLSDREMTALYKRIICIPQEDIFERGWESLSVAEISFGTSLMPMLGRLLTEGALRLVYNIDRQLTPLVHMHRASLLLHRKPRYADVIVIRSRLNLHFTITSMHRYLLEAGTPGKLFLRWDGTPIKVWVFADAKRYLDTLTAGTRRAGKTTGRPIGR